MSKKEASKKRNYGTNQKRRNVNIDDTRVEKLERIGSGNVSEGIRVATDAYDEKENKK